MPRGPLPVTGDVDWTVKPPPPFPNRMVIVPLLKFVTARSILPSALKSPAAMPCGLVPVGQVSEPLHLVCVNVPSPFPKKTETEFVPESATATSGMPSLLKSATAKACGFELAPVEYWDACRNCLACGACAAAVTDVRARTINPKSVCFNMEPPPEPDHSVRRSAQPRFVPPQGARNPALQPQMLKKESANYRGNLPGELHLHCREHCRDAGGTTAAICSTGSIYVYKRINQQSVWLNTYGGSPITSG